MSSVIEIEAALKKLPLTEAREVSQWLEQYLNEKLVKNLRSDEAKVNLPDYAAQRREIFGDKVLPNIVLNAREEERW